MKVKDIINHFVSRADERVNKETTVDRVIVGDPDLDVDRCLVSWMPNYHALEQVVERGMRLLICHEPTFWNHGNDKATEDPESQRKLAFIEKHGLVIVRNHDCWDAWPKVGVPWAWAKFLELDSQPVDMAEDQYHHRYDIDPMPLEAFAKRVAKQCATIGEPMVQVIGDGSQMVSRIGVGTGCACDIYAYQLIGCDCSIVCDDGSIYWGNIQKAKDSLHPVIRVNHGTAEEPGMVTMTQYINDHIDGVTAEHLLHGSTFRLMGAEGSAN